MRRRGIVTRVTNSRLIWGVASRQPSSRQAAMRSVIRDLVLLSCVSLRPVLVHGGGPEINSWLLRVGVEQQFRDGKEEAGRERPT